MARRLMKCLRCGRERRVSAPGTRCRDCGGPLTAAGGEAAAFGLPEFGGAPALAGVDALPDLERFLHPPPPPTRNHSSLVSGSVFLLVSGLMVAFQLFAPGLKAYVHVYAAARSFLALTATLLIAYNAAQDGFLRGLLCLVFPPYLLLYATGQEESDWLRGLFLGILLGVCAEAFLLPERSLILALGPAFHGLVEQVQGWIQTASRPPV